MAVKSFKIISMFKGIIFDFDGTLVRSHDEIYAVLRELCEEYRLSLPPPEEFRNMNTRETIRRLGIKIWQVPRFTGLARKKLQERLGLYAFEPGILDFLRELKNSPPPHLSWPTGKIQIGLVSSNSTPNVLKVLDRFGATDLFDKIHCGSPLLGKHRNIAQIVKQMKLKVDDCVYVGDETRDIEASRQVGVKVAAVAWGFHSIQNLSSFSPDYLVESVAELRSLVRGQLNEKFGDIIG